MSANGNHSTARVEICTVPVFLSEIIQIAIITIAIFIKDVQLKASRQDTPIRLVSFGPCELSTQNNEMAEKHFPFTTRAHDSTEILA